MAKAKGNEITVSSAGALDFSEITPQSQDTARKFVESLEQGMSYLVQAARYWIELAPEDQEIIRGKIATGFAMYLDRLPAIAGGTLLPDLIVMPKRSLTHVSRLSLEDQREALLNKVVVLDRNMEKRTVPLVEVDNYAKQVIGVKGGKAFVRSPAQQKNWLKQQEQIKSAPGNSKLTKIDRSDKYGYMIEDGQIYFDEDFADKLIAGVDVGSAKNAFIQLAKDLKRL